MVKNTHDSGNESASGSSISSWELAGLVAAVFLLLAPFLYLLRSEHKIAIPAASPLSFVGSKKCGSCHQAAFGKWKGSDHDLAMAPATDKTVLGDFNDASYTDPYNNFTSRFFRRDGRFFVETEGPDGKRGTFEITNTFGVYPLQQYLAPFPGGRLQCLNIAWDVDKKAWYRLPPYDVKDPNDWLHWTKGGQTWNGMCAECHSTRLHKGFNIETESYQTSWFEINVGCEACHGPGSKHVNWADQPAMARGPLANYGLAVVTSDLDTQQQITVCAPCHSRRFQLGDNTHESSELLDKMVPSLLEDGLYYPDGQISEEVYVYGSFTQSKMFQRGVRCSDCHDMHSLKLHKQDNALCLQCHRADDYDSPRHHFHKKVYEGKPSAGHLCVKCHMPGRKYMGIDYRPDHSLRVPRPDLSSKLGTPNSCSATGCHADKTLEWVNAAVTKWYGESRKPHYGELFAAARKREPHIDGQLRAVAGDGLQPAIVRATALSLLEHYPGEATTAAYSKSLEDTDALIRYTAIRALQHHLDQQTKLRLIAPKLYDKVKAVRIEAALALASLPISSLRSDDRETFRQVLEEYRAAMMYNADFAPQRYNLGNLAATLGNPDKAIVYYQQAIAIDKEFYPAKVNLAMQYNGAHQNEKAEQLLREVVRDNSQLYEVSYSLGLLLAEMQKLPEAAEFLGKAADGMPQYTRARFNQALVLLKLQRWQEAEKALLQTVAAEPLNREYFMTLANLYLSSRKVGRAMQLSDMILKKYPDHPEAKELQRLLKQK